MNFDELLQIDLNEEAERLKELEALRLANEDLRSDGSCPECQKISGDLQIGHTVLGFCIEHRLLWRIGHSGRDFRDDQRARWNEIGLDDYTESKGWVTGMRRTAENS